jgi:ferredoxin
MKTQTERGQIVKTAFVWVNPRNCNACGRCLDACPKQVLGVDGFFWHRHVVLENPDACNGCKNCLHVCPRKVFSENATDLFKSILAEQGIEYS